MSFGGRMWRTLAMPIVHWTLLLLLVLPILIEVEASVGNDVFYRSSMQPCTLKDPLMDPTYEERDGHYFVWQIPPNPKAILVIAHGGMMTPLSFFDPSTKCELCTGHPEDRKVVLEALRRGYAVIVVKSIGEAYFVEWPIEDSDDLAMLTNTIKDWRRKHSLENLPIAAWAHSAGGHIASALTITLRPLSGLVFMNCFGMPEIEEIATPSTFPPIFSVTMPVDQQGTAFNISRRVPEEMALFRKRGIEVVHIDLWPRQISPLFFSERIRCMSEEMSENIYSAFKGAGWLDENDYLTKNPRAYDWKVVVSKENALPVCTVTGELCFADDVEQELVDAYAEHSFSSDANDEVFPWLDSKMSSPTDTSGTLWSLFEMIFMRSGLHHIAV